MLGVLGPAGAAICLAPCGSPLEESNLGQAINAVTGTRLWAFVFSLPGTVLFLRGCGHCRWAAVVQRFVYFSAHPQVMQQHRQLSGGRHDGSLLAVPPSTFSSGGAALSLSSTCPTVNSLKLSFVLPGEKTTITAAAELVWKDVWGNLGIAFVNTGPAFTRSVEVDDSAVDRIVVAIRGWSRRGISKHVVAQTPGLTNWL